MDGDTVADPPSAVQERTGALRDISPTTEPGASRAVAYRERARRAFDGLLAGADVPLSRRDSVRRRLLALADVVSLCLAYGVVSIALPTPRTPSDAVIVAAALPLWVVLNKLLGLYDRDTSVIHKSTLDELPKILQSVTLGAGVIFLFGPPVAGLLVDRTQTLVFWAAACVLMPLLRWLARVGVRQRFAPERTLILGSGDVARVVARKINAHPEYGVKLVGLVDVSSASGEHGDHDPPLLGDIERFDELCREFDVERVVIAFSSALSHEHLLDAVKASKVRNLKVTIVPRLFEVIGPSVEIDQIEGMTMLGLRGLTRTRSSLMLKRAMDVAGAGLGLVMLAPLLSAIAIAVKVTSPGPVLYAQRRIGRGNKPFRIYKFRTMVDGAEALQERVAHLNEAASPMFKIADDPRVTPLGRFLRRTSLDELPQFLNVLRGEMSLVGPRPLVPVEDNHVIGWHRARLELTPGLTGPWQVLGRTAIPFEEMIKLDYLYVAEWSLWNDIKLLVRTAPVVLRGNGC